MCSSWRGETHSQPDQSIHCKTLNAHGFHGCVKVKKMKKEKTHQITLPFCKLQNTFFLPVPFAIWRAKFYNNYMGKCKAPLFENITQIQKLLIAKQLIRNPLGVCIKITPKKIINSKDFTKQYYQTCNLFVLSSSDEGGGPLTLWQLI